MFWGVRSDPFPPYGKQSHEETTPEQILMPLVGLAFTVELGIFAIFSGNRSGNETIHD